MNGTCNSADEEKETINQLRKMLDAKDAEIQRLTALVPKVVKPVYCRNNNLHRGLNECACGAAVNGLHRYRHYCGAKLDWPEK